MAKISDKILEIFRNLKSDAVPQTPRHEDVTYEENPQETSEDVDNEDDQQDNVFDIKDDIKDKDSKKPKFKKTFFKSYKKDNSTKNKTNKERTGPSSVNTQTTGNVINIVNSRDVHWGNEFVYHLGTKTTNKSKYDSELEEEIPKCNLITLLMEVKSQPNHEFLDYISKNLGKNWHSFFRRLGYTKGRIETVEIDEARHGVSEARYKLLLDWVRNEEDGSLGRLATLLWDHGEREVVKELALLYSGSKNRNSCNNYI